MGAASGRAAARGRKCGDTHKYLRWPGIIMSTLWQKYWLLKLENSFFGHYWPSVIMFVLAVSLVNELR